MATDPTVSVAPSVKSGDIFLTYVRWNDQQHWVEASGYLSGVVEDDGICTLTLANGTSTVTATNPGTSNVTSTSCGRLTVPGNKLSSGTWKATVTYRSAHSSGSSNTVEVTVP